MTQLYLGIVERVTHAPGPGARLKPVYQVSPERARWEPLREDFPNCGLVSWWQPPIDVSPHSAWCFQTEESSTFVEGNPHHDLFRVRGLPFQAVQVLDFSHSEDEEDIRRCLSSDGIPVSDCGSKRVAIKTRSGTLLGPVELIVRDDRAYLEDKYLNIPIQVSQPKDSISFAELAGNVFLPPDGWDQKIGEVDFSPDDVFVKRVLRDLKAAAPSIVEAAQLTERMISRYCIAFSTAQLTVLQRHRLARLKLMASKSQADVALLRDGLDSLLSLEVVSQALQRAKEEAERVATERIEATLSHLRSEQSTLESTLQTLNADILQREVHIKALEEQHGRQLQDFDRHVREGFERVAEQPFAFLANVAIVRAALGASVTPPHPLRNEIAQRVEPQSEHNRIECSELASVVRDRATRAGLNQFAARAVLASIVSGNVPIVFGSLARDTLDLVGDILAGGQVFWLPVNPGLTSPSELASVLLTSDASHQAPPATLGDLLQQSQVSTELSLLVLDNANLGQLDSVLLPVLIARARAGRPDVVGESASTDSGVSVSSTSVGPWPSNLLIAGLFIDSPLTLPISREVWSVATFINTDEDVAAVVVSLVSKPVSFLSRSTVSSVDWTTWQAHIKDSAPTELVILAGLLADRLRCGPQVRRRLALMAQSIESIFPECSSDVKRSVFLQCAIIPRCLSARFTLEMCSQDGSAVPQRVNEVFESTKALFLKWGLDAAR